MRRLGRLPRLAAVVALVAPLCALSPIGGPAPAHAASAPNDDIANATVLTGSSGTACGTSVDADMEPGESNAGPTQSIWFRWTAPFSGTVQFDTFWSVPGTEVKVYAAPTFAHADLVALWYPGEHDSRRQFSRFGTTAGKTYWIGVYTYDWDEGPVTVSWKPVAAPPNDNYANATALTGWSGSLTGTNADSTAEHKDPVGWSVWYRWTAPASGRAVFDSLGTRHGNVLSVFTGDAVESARPVAANRLETGIGPAGYVEFDAVAGTTYRIGVADRSHEDPAFTLRWNMPRPVPVNDDFADAVVISGRTGSIWGSTEGATSEPGEREEYRSSTWYRWTAPASGRVSFDTAGSPDGGGDVRVFKGQAVDALASPSDSWWDEHWTGGEHFVFDAVAGTEYRVMVDGRGGGAPHLLGWSMERPPHDDFANARVFSGPSGVLNFVHDLSTTSWRATAEPGEPDHMGSPAVNSIWFRWTPPLSGTARLRFHKSGFFGSVRWALYEGSTVSSLKHVASTKSWEIHFDAVAGRTYSLAVDPGAFGTHVDQIDYVVDGVAPSGQVVINGGASSTNDPVVRLDLTGVDHQSGVTHVVVTPELRYNQPHLLDGDWWPYRSKLDVSLASRATLTGTRTVYVQFVDVYGNVSPVFTDTIDLLAPLAGCVGRYQNPPPPPPPSASGYWMVGEGGDVYAFGAAQWRGNAPVGSQRAVDIEPTPDRAGYWVVTDTGQVFGFGTARLLGGSPVIPADEKVTSLSATPDGLGYWLFTTRGRVFSYGSAPWLGDMSAIPLNGPVLDSVPTPSGQGYYMVASDGGIFAFGDARFRGSMGGRPLNAPVQSLVPDPDGLGYWLVASDGGIFSFDAVFYGSMGGRPLNRPVTGMVGYARGYLMVAEDGGIFAFGDAPFHGSLGSNPPARPVVAVATLPRS